MKAAGYGFTRPKAPNDPVNGNQVNRRVEIYIRGLGPEQKAAERKAIQESSEAKFLEVR
jgi:hypothetical protein